MNMRGTICAIAVLLGPTFVASSAETPLDFAHAVAPILSKHCVECHGGDESKGGFSINTRALILDAEAATPGKSDESRLIELILSSDHEEQMPPKDRPRLSAKEVAALRGWVDRGLDWEEGFTFAPHRYEPPLRPRLVNLPSAIDGRHHPIDRILDTYLAERKLPRPQPLDDAAFMRRVYLDIIGLLPPPEKLAEYLADTRADRRSRLVSDVLADEQAYAEHWLAFWSDLLRNAYSGTGYIDNGRKQITGWLYESLLDNKPYDTFVAELISPTLESEGFIRGIKWRGAVNASQTREIQFAQNLGQVFLGINLKCASCHDSFIDRWTLLETYSLAAVFATGPLELHRCDKPTGQMARPAWLFGELGQIDPQAPQPQRLEQLARLMTHPDNGRLTRTMVNRIWQRMMGRGIVHPVDAMQNPPWSADLLDYLARSLSDNDYDLKHLIHLIATSQAYQSQAVALAERPSNDSYVYAGPLAKRMTAEQFLDALWTIGQSWPQPDARAFRRDGRQQGGHLAAILQARKKEKVDLSKRPPAAPWKKEWGDRNVRASLAPLDSLQASLGRPNREQVVTTRPSTLTTLEAITLANGQVLAETLGRGADHLLATRHASGDELIDWLYHYALSRGASSQERAVAHELLGPTPTRQGVEDFLWALMMLPEFHLIR